MKNYIVDKNMKKKNFHQSGSKTNIACGRYPHRKFRIIGLASRRKKIVRYLYSRQKGRTLAEVNRIFRRP